PGTLGPALVSRHPAPHVARSRRRAVSRAHKTRFPPAQHSVRNRAGLTTVMPAPHVQRPPDEGNRMLPSDPQPEIIVIRDRDPLVKAPGTLEASSSHHHARRAGDLVAE